VYDGVRMAAVLAGGRSARSRRTAPRLARAEGLSFREPGARSWA
jgi:urea transport system substrate-binding protein